MPYVPSLRIISQHGPRFKAAGKACRSCALPPLDLNGAKCRDHVLQKLTGGLDTIILGRHTCRTFSITTTDQNVQT